jgi:hypothetical protein
MAAKTAAPPAPQDMSLALSLQVSAQQARRRAVETEQQINKG